MEMEQPGELDRYEEMVELNEIQEEILLSHLIEMRG